MTTNVQRMRNTARRLVDEGRSQQYAMDYLIGFYGTDEKTAQVAVLDATFPGGYAAWMAPPQGD